MTTVNGAPIVASVVQINYQDETITFDDSALEMNTSSSFDGTYIVNGASISGYIPSPPQRYTTLSIRWKAADGIPASENGYVSIPARPETPSQAINNATEQITISAGQEYKIGPAGAWTAVTTETNVTVAPGAAISIRAAATKSAFKSEEHTVTAPGRADAPAVTIDYENETLSGTEESMEYGVVLSGQSVPSQWMGCSDNMTLSSLGWTGSELSICLRPAATTGQGGKYASNPVSLTIPARPETPAEPSVTDRTDESLTIAAVYGVQYACVRGADAGAPGDDGAWQTSANGSITFFGLAAGTAYTIYARIPAVTTGDTPAFASGVSSTQVTTKTSAGAAPTVNQSDIKVTANSITLPYNEAWEYSTNGADWYSGEGKNVITGLTPATEYTCYVRVAETDTAEASQTAVVTVYTAHAAPAAGEGYTIDYVAETITINNGYEVNTAEGFDGAFVSSGSLADYMGQTLYIRRKAGAGGAPASETVAVSLVRPGAPAVQGVNETVQGRNDGRIIGLTPGTAYEISSDNGRSWADVILTGTEITGLSPGAYQVRVKGSAVSFVGASAFIVIATGDVPTYTLNITAPVFDSVYTGYTQPEAKAVIISSAGNSDAAISSVVLTDDAGAFVLNKTDGTAIAAGATDETTYTIRPNAGLDAGSYTATIMVTYNDAAVAQAAVSFTVARQPDSSGGSTVSQQPDSSDGSFAAPRGRGRNASLCDLHSPEGRHPLGHCPALWLHRCRDCYSKQRTD